MPARGIDQVLPASSDPRLFESHVKDARTYVALAEEAHGPIPRPAPFDYVWGESLYELERRSPDLRIINLETSITTSEDFWEDKGIHYRMHPANTGFLAAAGVDCCVLANNHVLDWGREGLSETLARLRAAGIATVGAGENLEQAEQPAIFYRGDRGRIIVYAYASETSGVPASWAARRDRSGVNWLPNLSNETVNGIARQVRAIKRPRDIVIVSLHWGSNWGYQVPALQQYFAHSLIDRAGVDVVHGHSSHHPRAIEVYRDRLILYGCGDFLNDYEGIDGFEAFRGDLSLMYFVSLDPQDGKLRELNLAPMQIRNFRLSHASPQDALWMCGLLSREGEPFGTDTVATTDATLSLRWAGAR